MKELDSFLLTLRSQRTRDAYQRHIESFLKFKNIETLEDFKKITIDDLYEFKNYLIEEKHNSENSLSPKFMALNSFCRYLVSNSQYDYNENVVEKSNIVSTIKKVVDPEKRTFLTLEERSAFLAQCKNPRETAMCVVFLNTAIRVSELINLELDKLVFYPGRDGKECAYIHFYRKGGKINKLYFNSYVTEKISAYLKVRKESEYKNLFLSNAGTPLTVQSIDRTIHKLARKAGINKRVSAHSLRRTVATDMNRQGIGLKEIQVTLGHNSVGTTGLYIQDLDEDNENTMMNYVVK